MLIKKLKIGEENSLRDIDKLRYLYIQSLIEPQEMYLEILISKSKIFSLFYEEGVIGYFLTDGKDTLLEFFVIEKYSNFSDLILNEILKKYSIKDALCKSFDHQLLSPALTFQKSISVVGINFRKLKPLKRTYDFKELDVTIAEKEHLGIIKTINEEVFESTSEIVDYLEKQQILLFNQGIKLIGFGIFAPVIINGNDYDIGMCVNREFREKGYGTTIIRYLINYCIERNWRPIAGCDIQNIASRKCLEKAGFFSDYRLLQIIFS